MTTWAWLQDISYEGVTGRMKVGEVRQSQSKPTDTPAGIKPVPQNRYENPTYPGLRWEECPDYVKPYWHYVNGGFTSPTGFGYWLKYLEASGKPPLLPNWLNITVVSVDSADQYTYNTYEVDVSNTSVLDLKRNILKNRTQDAWAIQSLAYWTEMPTEEIKSIQSQGLGPNYTHTLNRLHSAALGTPVTVYDNGKKIDISSTSRTPVAPDDEVLAKFNLDETYPLVVNFNSTVKREQWSPTAFDIIFPIVMKGVGKVIK